MNNVVKLQNQRPKGKPLLGGTTRKIAPSFYWTLQTLKRHRKHKLNTKIRNFFLMSTLIRFHTF
jgi:hypothetical protein